MAICEKEHRYDSYKVVDINVLGVLTKKGLNISY